MSPDLGRQSYGDTGRGRRQLAAVLAPQPRHDSSVGLRFPTLGPMDSSDEERIAEAAQKRANYAVENRIFPAFERLRLGTFLSAGVGLVALVASSFVYWSGRPAGEACSLALAARGKPGSSSERSGV